MCHRFSKHRVQQTQPSKTSLNKIQSLVLGVVQISALTAGTDMFLGITAAPGIAAEMKQRGPCLSLPAHPAAITAPGSLKGITGQEESPNTAPERLDWGWNVHYIGQVVQSSV